METIYIAVAFIAFLAPVFYMVYIAVSDDKSKIE